MSRLFAPGIVLLLLASAPLSTAAPKTRYVISERGAVGDGATVNTRAIQSAIDACSKAGGGVLVVPRGVFLSGALYFRPGVDLLVEKDGVLKSTTSMVDFPPIYTRWEGIERYWTSAFLNFVGMRDVIVSGEGTIDGSGDAWCGFGKNPRPPWPPTPTASPGPPPKPEDVYPSPLPTTAAVNLAADAVHLPPVNAAGIRLPLGGSHLSPPRALVFQNCAGVRVSGLLLRNNARWGFVFIYCKDVVAEGLTVRAEHYIPSSDGIDVDSCRHVLITGCDIDCNDDCISIKSGKDEDGRRVNTPCEDVTIARTRFGYGQGGASMGSETSGGIRRVEVRDCLAEDGNWAPIRIKSQPSRGGFVEDVTYRNIELRGVLRAFEFDMAWYMRINNPAAARMPTAMRRIRLINVHGTARAAGIIHGVPERPIEDVSFVNCAVSADTGLSIEHAGKIDTSGLVLTVKQGVPITGP
jgi:exo-poly-alpha-galacturonosidase